MEVSQIIAGRSPESIRTAAAAYRAEHPRARARNVADGIGVSEAELLASRIGQPEEVVIRLRPEFPEILMQIGTLGPVMALTRNHACVHEKTGVYQKGHMMPQAHMGIFNDENIDLRLFFRSWSMGFFVVDEPRVSFQFFNKDGSAVHKIYDVEGTDKDAMRRLAESFKADDQAPEQHVEAVKTPVERPLSEIDTEGFVNAWQALEDTHDFFPLLRKFGISRRQALEVAPADLARKVDPLSYKTTLEKAAADEMEIMVFVNNRGCVQIHTGVVSRLVAVGPWYNVLDEGFNLHLKEEAVAECFVVTKPTLDGPVTALEVFDAEGELILQFFGSRKPGKPEQAEWRKLADSLA